MKAALAAGPWALGLASVAALALSVLVVPVLCVAYPLLELAWLLACQIRLWRANRCVPRPEDARLESRHVRNMQKRILQLGQVVSIESFFSGWFRGAPFSQIRRGNCEDFIAYGFYAKPTAELTAQELDELQTYVDEIEETYYFKFPPGRNPRLKFLAHLWEPIRYLHKPLLLYIAAEVLSLAVDGLLHFQGFRKLRCQGFGYWLYDPELAGPAPRAPSAASASSSSSSSPLEPRTPEPEPLEAASFAPSPQASPGSAAGLPWRAPPGLQLDLWDSASEGPASGGGGGGLVPAENSPLVLLHGVGLGMAPYLGFLSELRRAFPGRPFLVLDLRHVAVSLSHRAPSTDACAAAVAAILRQQGWRQAAFVGHSYGTFVLSRVAQLYPHLVQSMALIDPCCMLTLYPQLLRNFVYKLPSPWRGGFHGAIDCLRYLFSRDLTIARVFCREFIWHRECLWPEDFPQALLLVLSAADDLVPTPLVQAQVRAAGARCQVLCHATAGHGGFLLKHAWRAHIITCIQATVARGAALAAKAGY